LLYWQTAGFAATILKIKGYSNVFDLQWGMCSWAYPDRWNTARTNGQNNPITLQTTSNLKMLLAIYQHLQPENNRR
jgi:hypothetical protein